MNNILNDESLFKNKVNKMFESSLRRKNRRSTIIASVLGWMDITVGYSFGLFKAIKKHLILFKNIFTS